MKRYWIVMVLLSVFMVTGCSSVYNLTTEDSDMVAEYAAGVLCNFAYVNERDYIELQKYLAEKDRKQSASEMATEAPSTPSDTNVEVIDPMQTGTDGENNGSAVASNMAQILGMQDVLITCLGYEITDVYPKDEFALCTEATDGHKLIVVQYELMNLTSDPVIMQVNEDVSVKAVINDSKNVKQYVTLLNDDIMNMNGKQLLSGEVIQGVFVFNVEEELCNNIASLNVIARK